MVAGLTAEKRPFVLYEYLRFFWQRKWWFLVVPLATIVLTVIAGRLLLQGEKYTGKAVVFTGSIDVKELTDPKNIEAKFPEVKNLDVVVPEEQYVQITVKGDDEQDVSRELKLVVSEYSQELKRHSQERIDVTTKYLHALEERERALQQKVDYYSEQIQSGRLNPEQLNDISDLLVESENNLTEVMERVNRIRGNLVFYEKPAVLSETVAKSKTYTGQLMAVGLVLGLFLTVVWLVLWKYILDARRYYSS